MAENEKLFESKIEEYLVSPSGGFTSATDAGYDPVMALDIQHGEAIQLNIFDPEDHSRLRRLMKSIDGIQRS